ncbi:Uncharacterised protein [Mycobacteroides abscessus subsp. abscessus]|nr:Uncharacterised protein [Mycobacteroides abscessus subsp. abscessus]SIA89753.1 Uncharacterised protein [Mycobacteroides abscessus subsp. abscessus]SKR85106.1 Uncharacterised protein [Mycobacteroides abscessus subsp. abscessus]
MAGSVPEKLVELTTGVTEYLLNAGIDPLRAGLDGYNIVRGVLEGIGDMPVADLLNWGNDDYESSG